MGASGCGVGLAGDGLSWPCGSCWFWRADLECLRRGHAIDAVLGGCDLDEPRTGVLEADRALRGALRSLLVGRDLAGATGGSGSPAGGGDGVRHPSGGGEATADWLVGSACA